MLFEFNRTDRIHTAFRCCTTHHPRNGTNVPITCHDLRRVHQLVIVVHFIGFLLYCFCPLLLKYFGCSSDHARKGQVPSVPFSGGADASLIDMRSEDDSEMWISNNTVVTGNVCAVLFNACGCCQWMVKLRRAVLFLFIIPSVSITKVLVYYRLYKYNDELIYRSRFDIPLGILAVPLGFKAAAYNWKCFLGGPFVVLGIYITFGLIFVLVPSSIPDLLTKGILDVRVDTRPLMLSPLCMDLHTLSKFASFETRGYPNTRLVYVSILVRLRALINVKFWRFCFQMWRARYHKTLKKVSQCFTCHRNSPRLIYLFIPVFFVLYCLVVLLEGLLLLIYNGLPIVSCTCLIFMRYIQFVLRVVKKKTKNVFIKVSITSFVAVILTIVTYALMIILIDSFVFIATTINYTLLGVIVNARDIVNYILFLIIFAVYISKCVIGIIEEYNHLFSMVVDASVTLAAQRHHLVAMWRQKYHPIVNMTTHSNMAEIPNHHLNVHHINISLNDQHNDSAYESLGEADLDTLNCQNFGYIRIYGSSIAIPERLFRHVIEKHRPLRNIVMTSVIKLTLTCLVALGCLVITLTFKRGTDLEHILQIAAIIMSGLVPLLLKVFQSPISERQQDRKFREDLVQTVSRFWKEDMNTVVD